jgi:hypothetical protein
LKIVLFIGWSITKGAVMASRLRAATKVVIFQWPCGTLPINRSPRRHRPLDLAILVLVPVSSMKISLSGSSSFCALRQRSRAAATSGRSCSLA